VLGILSHCRRAADRALGHALVTPPARLRSDPFQEPDPSGLSARFEPPLDFFGGRHSIQLSYRRIVRGRDTTRRDRLASIGNRPRSANAPIPGGAAGSSSGAQCLGKEAWRRPRLGAATSSKHGRVRSLRITHSHRITHAHRFGSLTRIGTTLTSNPLASNRESFACNETARSFYWTPCGSPPHPRPAWFCPDAQPVPGMRRCHPSPYPDDWT